MVYIIVLASFIPTPESHLIYSPCTVATIPILLIVKIGRITIPYSQTISQATYHK